MMMMMMMMMLMMMMMFVDEDNDDDDDDDDDDFDIFLIFAQNIDCGYTLEPPRSDKYPQSVLEEKIRKIGIPRDTPVSLYESGVQGNIHCTDMIYNQRYTSFFPDLT